MKTGLSALKSYFFATASDLKSVAADRNPDGKVSLATGQDKSSDGIKRNLNNFLTPVQLDRIKVDIGEWRRAISEAEFAYYPHRVRMQRMYIDTILNGHVYSVMERRKDLTLLRGYEIGKKQRSKFVASEDLTDEFESYTWFQDALEYAMDALFFGYSLISLGDIEGSKLKDVELVRRWNVSPDRELVSTLIYSLTGKRWDDEDTKPWHIYVKTKSENGTSKCGYGLFYKIALYEIFLRNVLGYNGDFVELYSQPYRVGKTTKTTESERAELEAAVRNMGSSGYAIIDPLDEIEFLETALGGTGWQGYDNLEQRCQKTVSKIVLGHADAMDSVPGKLGAGQGEDSPAVQAMKNKQSKDGKFLTPIVNNEIFWRVRELGLSKIPEGYILRLKNDDEEEAFRSREDQSNLATAQIALTMKNAGLQMDAEYFEGRTGIPTTEAPQPEPMNEPNNPQKFKNMMEGLYAK